MADQDMPKNIKKGEKESKWKEERRIRRSAYQRANTHRSLREEVSVHNRLSNEKSDNKRKNSKAFLLLHLVAVVTRPSNLPLTHGSNGQFAKNASKMKPSALEKQEKRTGREAYLFPYLVVVVIQPLDLALAHEGELQQGRLDRTKREPLEAQE